MASNDTASDDTAPSAPRRRDLLRVGAALPAAPLLLSACSDDGEPGEMGEPDLVAEVDRAAPGAPTEAGALATPFAARLLATLDRERVNLICSPLSAQVALAMAGLGAIGDTRAQMEDALGGEITELAQAANTLAQTLAAVGDAEREEPEEDDAPEPPIASLVNGTWLQEGLAVQQTFLGDLSRYFASGVYTVDFVEAQEREDARERINTWVEDATAGLIEDLIPEGRLTAETRLVLVNALHLKAAWPEPLTPQEGTFTLAGGEQVPADMLVGSTTSWYEDALCQATSLPTHGDDLSLAVIRPTGGLDEVLDAWAESAADPEAGLGAVLAGLAAGRATTTVTLPALDLAWDDSLAAPLQALGMVDAFTGAADFSGITDQEPLHIGDVLQKAVLVVDEEGMEAAAATAVIAETGSAPLEPHELVLDVPFLVVAVETASRAPLVLGWVGDPRAE